MNLADLVKSRPVVGDGAMGTMLQAHGLAVGACPDALNLEDPDAVVAVHRAYREAGSDYLETNTFGSNRLKMAAHGLAGDLGEIIARGVEHARKAAAGLALVAGSVGPTGRLLEPYGDTPRRQVVEAFAETAGIMDRAGIDFYLVETMTDVNEALAAIEAIRSVSPRPIVATAVLAKSARGYRTLMGTPAGEAASLMVGSGASMVGTNCCVGMADAAAIMEDMLAATPAALIAQPNAGLPRMVAGSLVYPESPEAMAADAGRLLGLGVRIIGGCCGTTPAHIRAISAAMGR
jgi:5-methyltetrahydrofolate--homocysteine methyltransferase